MSQSLASKCTPLKQTYDACFNSWFEGYLEPAIAAATNQDQDQRVVHSKKKADEFQEKCGKIWEEYKACVQVRLGFFFDFRCVCVCVLSIYFIFMDYRKL